MADSTYSNLSGVEGTFVDYGLQANQTIDLGDSLLVLGTAPQGPLLQPVSINGSLDRAIEIFGPFGEGSLVKGIFEAMNASNRVKDIRGMRIGNATKATLSLPEQSETGGALTTVDDATKDTDGEYISDAIVFSAKKEGKIGNSFSVYKGIKDGTQVVAIYNPYTDITSTYSLNLDPKANATVHDVKELADAVNSDTNLEDYLTATMKELTAQFEVNLNNRAAGGVVEPYASGVLVTGASGTVSDGDIVYLTLSQRLNSTDVGLESGADPLPSGVHDVKQIFADRNDNIPTAGNRLLDLQEVYLVERNVNASGTYGFELLETKGLSAIDLDYLPIGRNDIEYWEDGNRTLISLDGNTWTTPQCKQVVVKGLLGQQTDTTTLAFDYTVWAEPASSTVKIYQARNGAESLIPASGYSGVFSGTGATGKYTVTFEPEWKPPLNSIITISFISNSTIALTEHANLSELEDNNTWTDYFVSGKNITFGDTVPEDIWVTYRRKRTFSIGGDVSIVDAYTGKLQFPNATNSPKLAIQQSPPAPAAPNGAAYTGAIIGLTYTYQPEWVNITSSAQALSGGADGIVNSKQAIKDSLTSAFDALENYVVDIVVLKDLYLDETMEDYDPNTGLLTTQSVGFAPMFCSFLDQHAQNTDSPTWGIMSVKPATSSQLSDINTWYKRLTIVDSADPTRAANIMAGINCRWLSVVAAEPIFSNARFSVPYVGTMEAAYAGLMQALSARYTLSSSAVSSFSTTNKPIGGVVGTRYRLSKSQLNGLVGGRYVTLRNREPNGLVIERGITAAEPGSDYTSWSTTKIIKLVMEVVVSAADPFIGEPNTSQQRDALYTAVNSGIQALIEAQFLQDAAMSIEATVAEQLQGVMRVEMVLVPAFETRKIKVTVRLRSQLA
jgi:hypothetical protein